MGKAFKTVLFGFWASMILSACQEPSPSSNVSASPSTCGVAAAFRGEQPVAGRKGPMVLLPHGCRNMWKSGQPKAPNDSFFCVGPFWMDSAELTIGEYKSLMGRNSSFLHNELLPDKLPECSRCPIENLTWFEAVLVANARTKRDMTPSDTVYRYDSVEVLTRSDSASLTGWAYVYAKLKPDRVVGLRNLRVDTTKSGYRLPADQEWDWAAMADFNPFSLWDEYPDSIYQWTSSSSTATTQPVASKPWMIWGLYDMKGNAWEWTDSRQAFGGGWRSGSSFYVDLRNDDVFGEDFAGARFVRRVGASELPTSILRRTCR